MKKFILFLIMEYFITTALFSVMLDYQPLEPPLPQGDYFSPQPEQDQPQDDTDPILQLAHHIFLIIPSDEFALFCNQLAHYIANHQPHTDIEATSSDPNTLVLSPDIWASGRAPFEAITNHYAYRDLCSLFLYLTQKLDNPQQDYVLLDDGQNDSDDGQDAYYETTETEEDDFPLLICPDETTKLLNSSKTPPPLPESPNVPPQTVHPHKKNQRKNHQCPHCGHPPFTSTSNLNTHIKTKHEGITYQCTHCDHRPFSSALGLNNHIDAKHKEITHQCPDCDHPPFIRASSLRKHINAKHKGITYQCPHCKHHPFIRASSLRRHVQTLHESIRYPCPYPHCNHHPFTSEAGLRNHFQTKHKRKIYQCQHCDHSSFTSVSGLYYHVQTKHNGTTYQCPHCNSTYTQKGYLTTHIKTKHPDQYKLQTANT